MGISIKSTRSADFCAEQIDVITNFAVITNVVINSVHCSTYKGRDYFVRRVSIAPPPFRNIRFPYLY